VPGQATARAARRLLGQHDGGAAIEAALVLTMLLLIVFGVVAIGRLIDSDMAVKAVAREAARSAALADTAQDATSRGLARGQEVATGYHLSNGSLNLAVNAGGFQRGGHVLAVAEYTVRFDDLPLLHWTEKKVTGQDAEPIGLYRSRWNGSTS
jgi:Flp pilus assembly protein TadG